MSLAAGAECSSASSVRRLQAEETPACPHSARRDLSDHSVISRVNQHVQAVGMGPGQSLSPARGHLKILDYNNNSAEEPGTTSEPLTYDPGTFRLCQWMDERSTRQLSGGP